MDDPATYARTRDPDLRDRIIADHMWLAELLARNMRRRWEPVDDLEQIAAIGLLAAVDRYDPTHGTTFNTYATATIRGHLLHHMRTTWTVHVPRSLQELHLRIARLTDTLTAELGRTPTVAELAAGAHVNENAIIEARGLAAWPTPITHDAEVDDRMLSLQERTVDHDARIDVLEHVARLDPRQHAVIWLRYFRGHTQHETAQLLAISQGSVHRAERAGLERLSHLIG